tara:strand:- start:440 stop:1681 length:1242 start_codon:yes stop_codon:yes gene_type:complete
MNLYEGFVDGDADGISISKNLKLNTSGIDFKCDGSKPPPPHPPPPPPPPSSPDEPNPYPPSDFNKGYIEYKNDSTTTINIWFTKNKIDSTQWTNPYIDFDSITTVKDNMKLLDPEGNTIDLTIIDKNGFTVPPKYSLFLKLYGSDTYIKSASTWFMPTNVIKGPDSGGTPNVSRFEFDITEWDDGNTKLTGDYSFVDGINSKFKLSKSMNNLSYISFGVCDIKGLTEKECNTMGGTWSTLPVGDVGQLPNIHVCSNPGKAKEDGDPNKPWKYKSKKYPSRDLVGCGAGPSPGLDGLSGGTCNCLQTWYATDKTDPYYISDDLQTWINSIHKSCPVGYPWAFHEQEPNKEGKKQIQSDNNWCLDNINPGSNSWHDIAIDLKNNGLFKDAPVLNMTQINKGDILKILVSIKKIIN